MMLVPFVPTDDRDGPVLGLEIVHTEWERCAHQRAVAPRGIDNH
jgi:hypothetical protein